MRMITIAIGCLCMATTGCFRHSNVSSVSLPDTGALRDAPITSVTLVPFHLDQVQLTGDHGHVPTTTQRWFPHLVVGASHYARKNLPGVELLVLGQRSDYAARIHEDEGTIATYVTQIPADTVVVSGDYLQGYEMSALKRANFGMMAGKTKIHVEINIATTDADVYRYRMEGKYLGTSYSLGYESLGANESIGVQIMETIQGLRDGSLRHYQTGEPPTY